MSTIITHNTKGELKPWMIIEKSSWLEDVLGLGYCRLRIDTSHPEWIKQVLLPTIEKCKKTSLWKIK